MVLPTSSMSRVRTHFWMLVARTAGGGASPRKYGLNGTMPALTNSRLGRRAAARRRDDVCPVRSKCSRKRLMISWVCTGMSLLGRRKLAGRAWRARRLVLSARARPLDGPV